jgi:hypothetical protein
MGERRPAGGSELDGPHAVGSVPACQSPVCAECATLSLKRDRLWEVYCYAITVLTSCEPTGGKEYMRLQEVVEESRIEFNLAATESYQHRYDRHPVPN